MNKFILFFTVMFTCTICVAKQNAKWYRYYQDGVPHVSEKLTKLHIRLGYEELDSGFRLIKKHEPYIAEDAKKIREDKIKQAEIAKAKQQKKDQLFKNYDSSDRAVRKRKDLINDINSKRLFAQQEVLTAESDLKIELDKAATLEKSGGTISDDLKNNIANKKKELQSVKMQLNDLVSKQYAELDELTMTIRKLRKYEKEAD